MFVQDIASESVVKERERGERERERGRGREVGLKEIMSGFEGSVEWSKAETRSKLFKNNLMDR